MQWRRPVAGSAGALAVAGSIYFFGGCTAVPEYGVAPLVDSDAAVGDVRTEALGPGADARVDGDSGHVYLIFVSASAHYFDFARNQDPRDFARARCHAEADSVGLGEQGHLHWEPIIYAKSESPFGKIPPLGEWRSTAAPEQVQFTELTINATPLHDVYGYPNGMRAGGATDVLRMLTGFSDHNCQDWTSIDSSKSVRTGLIGGSTERSKWYSDTSDVSCDKMEGTEAGTRPVSGHFYCVEVP